MALMLTLAAQFDLEHSLLDDGYNENYHSYFEEYEEARMHFQHTALRLARLALSVIDDEVPNTSPPPPKNVN